MCAGDEGYWERYDNTRASASRTFLALVELGALIAYLGGIEGNVLHVLALRERTGVSGGVIMGIVACSRSCGRDGVARYTLLQAPVPIDFFRSFSSKAMV